MDLTPDVCGSIRVLGDQPIKQSAKRAESTTAGQIFINRDKSLILSPQQQRKLRPSNSKQQNSTSGTLVLGLKSVRFMEKTQQLQTEHTPSNKNGDGSFMAQNSLLSSQNVLAIPRQPRDPNAMRSSSFIQTMHLDPASKVLFEKRSSSAMNDSLRPDFYLKNLQSQGKGSKRLLRTDNNVSGSE